jgi:hypothetical protein
MVMEITELRADDGVEEGNLQGKSPFELLFDSLASLSIRKILMRAGYGTV